MPEGDSDNLKRTPAKGTYDAPAGGEVKPAVNWQIPAIGNRKLTPFQARELADFLDSFEEKSERNRGWLKFILLGEEPADMADHLREQADRAESEVERFKTAVRKERQRALEDVDEG